MANKKEIEVKLKVTNREKMQSLKALLSHDAVKLEEVEQRDVYYSPINDNYMSQKYPYRWLRLRYLSDGKAELCYKHFYPERAEKHLYCNEYQSGITEPGAIEEIFRELNLQIVADVRKKRTTYSHGRYLVSFDDVSRLGEYIEVELQEIMYDEEKERELLKMELVKLGINEFPVDLRGYPYLVYQMRNQVIV